MYATREDLQALTDRRLEFSDVDERLILAYSERSHKLTVLEREHFQIFDKDDNPVFVEGKSLVLYRGECHGPDRLRGLYHRGSNVFLINGDKVYFARRSQGKDLYPGCTDFSIGEHVRPFETYIEAAVRGAEEELGLKIRASDLIPYMQMPIHDTHQYEQVAYFLLNHEGKGIVHSEELDGGEWHDIHFLKCPAYIMSLNFRQDHLPALDLLRIQEHMHK